jgi:hypothetical protein
MHRAIPRKEEWPMNEAREKIMEVIIRSPGSQLEEVVFECPDLT